MSNYINLSMQYLGEEKKLLNEMCINNIMFVVCIVEYMIDIFLEN